MSSYLEICHKTKDNKITYINAFSRNHEIYKAFSDLQYGEAIPLTLELIKSARSSCKDRLRACEEEVETIKTIFSNTKFDFKSTDNSSIFFRNAYDNYIETLNESKVLLEQAQSAIYFCDYLENMYWTSYGKDSIFIGIDIDEEELNKIEGVTE